MVVVVVVFRWGGGPTARELAAEMSSDADEPTCV
jgi:hypothetical protein